ncbi:guanylate kinase [Thermodesulfovibrio yellowstonii]|uniref:Guanylate kinase n=2 Tax=Thermodesulfovibrio yellowstonii TaxID=28262 RepID=B5YJ36_THEYD|nr:MULTISPECIES: guanylate kinase [Thermodesulfovibrio]ACI21848.1 guanylate kinase [Thermodesulfovibrio yellowstonii DSM 11347]MBC7188813.1 guanylate kinase [Candidatus Aerophobetes bacterium]MDI6865058.1 guanylate kinase [Thermodesulfovibrio yellowstonii]GLI54230.1 guanylate kinase [Thermodesulfovibrio islandicus]
MEIYKKGIIFVISAPSGTGKTTLCERLLKILPDLKMSISHTTRQPRPYEKNGVDYFFVDKKNFEKMIVNDEFIEWAEVYGNFYGTSKKVIFDLIKNGYDILLDIDTQGAKNIRKLYPDSVLIFILPPSLKELEKRLLLRNEDKDIIDKRLSKASQEISQYKFYDYVVINDSIERALNDLLCIIYAERLKTKRIEHNKIDEIFKK